jgi:hypothetical protein
MVATIIKIFAIVKSLEKITGIGPINTTPPAFFSIFSGIETSFISDLKGKEKIKRMNERKINNMPKKLSIPLPAIKGNMMNIPASASPLINAIKSRTIPKMKKIVGNLLSISSLPPLVGLYGF